MFCCALVASWLRLGGLAKRKNLVLESFHVGGVAQLGERRVRNAKVGSSILLLSTNRIRRVAGDFPCNPF